jgi:phosphatidylserine decarboxylase
MRAFDRAWILLQYLLPQHGLTGLVHALARAETPWLKRALIRGFLRRYAVNLAEAADSNPERYASFNEFFTRALAPGARPLDRDPNAIVSPCDGIVSACGTIDGERLLQAPLAAKRRWYTLAELLGGGASAGDFVGGSYATLYLAPQDYHRVHAPLAGLLTAVTPIAGRLFSVDARTASAVSRLYSRNARVVCRIATGAGPLAVVLVGALNVSSISIVGRGELARGAELGRFNLGSTVIVLLPRGRCDWLAGLTPGAVVRVGTAIGRLRS